MTIITSISPPPLHTLLRPQPSSPDNEAVPASDKASARGAGAGLLQRWPLARLYSQHSALQQTTLQLQGLAARENMLTGQGAALAAQQAGAGSDLEPQLDSVRRDMERLRQQRSAQLAALGLAEGDDPAAALAEDYQLLRYQDQRMRQTQRGDLQFSLQQLRSRQAPPAMDALAAASTALVGEQQDYLDSLPGPRMASESQLAQILSSQSPPATQADSHYDFYDEVLALLKRLDGEWLTRYQDLLHKYIDFFDRLTGIMAKLKDAIESTNSDGDMIVDFRLVAAELEALMNSFSALSLGGSFKTAEEAQAFLNDLGLNGIVVRIDGKGGYELAIDRKLIEDLRETLRMEKGGGGNDGPFRSTINPARYNSIIAAKDSLMERFNHINRVMTEKYQRQLQLWDTLVKTLTGTIDAISEADRLYAQNFT